MRKLWNIKASCGRKTQGLRQILQPVSTEVLQICSRWREKLRQKRNTEKPCASAALLNVCKHRWYSPPPLLPSLVSTFSVSATQQATFETFCIHYQNIREGQIVAHNLNMIEKSGVGNMNPEGRLDTVKGLEGSYISLKYGHSTSHLLHMKSYQLSAILRRYIKYAAIKTIM